MKKLMKNFQSNQKLPKKNKLNNENSAAKMNNSAKMLLQNYKTFKIKLKLNIRKKKNNI